MQGIRGASRHCPAFVMELDRDISKEPNTIGVKKILDREGFIQNVNCRHSRYQLFVGQESHPYSPATQLTTEN